MPLTVVCIIAILPFLRANSVVREQIKLDFVIGNPAFASTNKLLDENLIFCIENTANCRQSKAKNKLV